MSEEVQTEQRAWFVGYLPYVDGDFDYERARCQTRRPTPARLTRRRIR